MRGLGALATLLAALALGAIPAQAEEFGFKDVGVQFTDEAGEPDMRAGSHPFAFKTAFDVKTEFSEELGEEIPAGMFRDLRIEFPPGLVGSPTATPRCEGVDFATIESVEGLPLPACSNSSVVGFVAVRAATALGTKVFTSAPLFNLVPPPGTAAKFGFIPVGSAPVTVEAQVEETPPYNLFVTSTNITQTVRFFGAETTVWGNPSDPSHDEERGICGAFFEEGFIKGEPSGEKCPTSNPNRPFLTLPRSCQGPLQFLFEAFSWEGEFASAVATTQGAFGEEVGVGDCESLGFAPRIDSKPTARSAESASGLDFTVEVQDAGLSAPEGRANSDIKRAEVILPEGVTINPSQAEGLGVCSEADFARETASSQFGEGCPGSSKVGTVEVETPLLEGTILKGTLFVAEPLRNRFGSLIALYMTVKEPKLGIGIKLAGKVAPDPRTGQLITTFDDLPQLPFSEFRLHFREGARSPLVTPPACGTYTTRAKLTPWANPATTYETTSSFQVTSGVGGGPCPAPGRPPFDPGFTAGTLNNDAGSYSPFYMRLTRRDGDQDLTRFSATLPKGLVAKLAGVSLCPEAQIAAARAKTGRAEQASPSCPLDSRIAGAIAGAGVGSQLTYVPGSVYLAGPYNGAPLSVVAIVPAVAGPFDVGTVLTRQALQIDPRSAEVTVDGDRSDPIPHILAGIPLRVRDIRVNVDRSAFTLNPTGCAPDQIIAKLWGGGSNPFSLLDDAPLTRAERFQAADCASLAFKPRLAMKLRGGTERGAHPAFRAVLRPRAGNSNLKRAVVRLPRSAFLEQAHIRTICTRVQFAADSCPAGAVYGRVRAFTPLLSEPLEGPAYLRSSDNELPDLVFDLHGLVDFEAVGRIDSHKGGIRASFDAIPDAPISKVVINMQGGRKGLIVNSTSLCAARHRAAVRLEAHNGRRQAKGVVVRASGCRNR